MFPLEKYTYIVRGNTIKALQTYAGRVYAGVAKCAPQDTFDFEKGKRLAAARCNLKIAKARANATIDRYKEVTKQRYLLSCKLCKLGQAQEDTWHAFEEASNELVKLESEL